MLTTVNNVDTERSLKMTLDGEEVSFSDGETIYEVATRARREIPTLCYDDRLEAFGACRLCVVEVEGVRQPRLSSAKHFSVRPRFI